MNRLVQTVVAFATFINMTDVALAADRFTTLIDLAKISAPVTNFDEVEGAYSGRCYNQQERYLPTPTMLYLGRTNIEGPLFPGLSILLVTPIPTRYSSESPDAFDSFNRDKILQVLEPLKNSFQNATEKPLSVDFIYSSYFPFKISFYKYGKYILTLTEAARDQSYMNGGINELKLSKGEVWAACYYFIKK